MAFYLQIPNIKGSSTDSKHQGWIKLESMDLSTSRSIYVKPGSSSDREYSIPEITDFLMVKNIDLASPKLFEKSLTGENLGKIIIHAQNTSDNKGLSLEYTLHDAVISRYHISGVSPDSTDQFKETLYINFTKVQMKYIPFSADGRSGTPISSGYDIGLAEKM